MNSIIQSKGLSFMVRPGTTDEKVVPEVVTKHSYERKDFKIEPGEFWADIGANIGTFSCFAAQRGAKVISFEPEDENFALLNTNIGLNGFGSSVRTIKKAVTFRGKNLLLYKCKSERNKYRHSTIPHKNWLPVKVAAISFQDVVAEGVNCIKLDCEGSELEIFDNFTNWGNVNKLVFEYHFDLDRQIANFLARMEKLGRYFSQIYYSKLPATATYDFFPASKIVFCQK